MQGAPLSLHTLVQGLLANEDTLRPEGGPRRWGICSPERVAYTSHLGST